MKLSQYTAFVAIADTGSFTKAAEALSISQSAVSHAMASLEKTLGVVLMRRSRSGVEFTEVGRRILAHARTVVLGTEQILQEAEALRADRSGTLHLGTSQSFGARLLPRLLTEFRSALPDVEIVLSEGTDQEIAEWLGGYTIDVGIVALPKENLTTVPLLEDEMCVVLPPHHPLADRSCLRLEEVADEEFIMPVGGVEPMLRSFFRGIGRDLRVGFHVHDVNGLLSMVAEGHGITVVPALALPRVLPHPQLRVIPFAPSLSRRLGIGIRTGARRSPAVEAFVSMARALARDDTWSRSFDLEPDRGARGAVAGGAGEPGAQMPWRQGDPVRAAAAARSGAGSAPAARSGALPRVSACPAMASAS
ncbi:LysR family transcriptional regulator [Streptomyces sp. NPDC058655]|uniref:LysR family transcriptional regulator n=1 Tax=Streptomyces sp. NPDC058655 TaxID=3346577 RepID=UPI00365C6C7C